MPHEEEKTHEKEKRQVTNLTGSLERARCTPIFVPGDATKPVTVDVRH